MKSAGLAYDPPKQYLKVDPERATRIANAFDEMKHDPDDPKVKASYAALAKEVLAQWQVVEATGLKVDWIKADQEDPYAASLDLVPKDVRENNHLWGFPTDLGFGSDPSVRNNNPMLQPTDVVIGGHKCLVNDVFRIVHDYFGHIKEGSGFSDDGEENAWRSHAAMFSPLARGALTSETRGQASWVNHGPEAEFNRTASAADMHYAPQKIGLMPEWTYNEGRKDPGAHDAKPRWTVPSFARDEFKESDVKRDDDGKFAEQVEASAAKRGRNPKFPYVPVTVRNGRTSQVMGVAFATRGEAIEHAKKTIKLRNEHYAAQMAAYAKRHAEAEDAEFKEADHPRGQPDNAGQFTSGEGGGGAKAEPWHQDLSGKWTGEKPTTFYRGTNVGGSRSVAGDPFWDKQLFVSSKLEEAKAYGKNIEKLVAKPDAKILYEGTKEFRHFAKGVKGSLLDSSTTIAQRAKEAGYDAVWFRRQGDVGTAINNPDAFEREGKADLPDAVKDHKYFKEFLDRDAYEPVIEGKEIVFNPKPTPHMEKFHSGYESQPDKYEYYDPRYAKLETLNEDEPIIARQIAVMKDDVPFEIEPLDDPDTIYRGMSAEEYDSIMRTGEVKSKGEANIGEQQEGLTYWTTDAKTADSYANGFATAQWKPTPTHPAYIVATKRPAETKRVKGTGEDEVGVSRPIKRAELTGIWRGDVVAYTPGRYTVPENDRSGVGGVSPRADVRWSKIDHKAAQDARLAADAALRQFMLGRLAADAEFKEENVKRDDGGKFATQAGGGGGKIQGKDGKQYEVTHSLEGPDNNHTYTVSHNGNKIGEARLSHTGKHVVDLGVAEEHRHNGIATKLYNHIEDHLGYKLQPSPTYQTPAGQGFWKSRNKPDTGAAPEHPDLVARKVESSDPEKATHFVGFRDGDHYHNAIKVFGEPDFIHRVWDHRAHADIAPGDTVVFAKGDADKPPSAYSYDDSNQPDDPAAAERVKENNRKKPDPGKDLGSADIMVGDRKVKIVKSLLDRNYNLVNVDVSKFDQVWRARDRPAYIGEGGSGDAIKGRYERFENFLKEDVPVEASTVAVWDDGTVRFGNGRHRYAVMRDRGVKRMPMAMSPESVENAKKHGYLVGREAQAQDAAMMPPELIRFLLDRLPRLTQEI